MDVKLVNRGAEGELILTGDLDTRTARDADQLFAQLVPRFTTITLNMQGLNYISSAGIRTIRNLYLLMMKKSGKRGGTSVNANVMEVFEMTGLAGLLNIR